MVSPDHASNVLHMNQPSRYRLLDLQIACLLRHGHAVVDFDQLIAQMKHLKNG